MLWEFEAGEMAIDVDPTALKATTKTEKRDGRSIKKTTWELPTGKERLFRKIDLGADDTYKVFSPTLRDANFAAGLNRILLRVEDQIGLARGSLSDVQSEARTATEIRALRQRTLSTVNSIQAALEDCLDQTFAVMDLYATKYNLAAEAKWSAAFQWDDSIVTDAQQQLEERLMLVDAKIMSSAELRAWYKGETIMVAEKEIAKIEASRPKLAELLDD
jgi:A118 family predicted phage portal protein